MKAEDETKYALLSDSELPEDSFNLEPKHPYFSFANLTLTTSMSCLIFSAIVLFNILFAFYAAVYIKGFYSTNTLLKFQSTEQADRMPFINDSTLSKLIPPVIQLNESMTYERAEAETTNLAALYYTHWKEMWANKQKYFRSSKSVCPQVQLPKPYDLRMNNLYWQVLTREVRDNSTETGKTTLTSYLLNAYYDDRLSGQPKVRSLWVTSTQMAVVEQKWRCLLWFEDSPFPVLSKISELDPIWPPTWTWGRKDGVFGPLLGTCDIPPKMTNKVPLAISIQSTGSCSQVEKNPTNVLRVLNIRPSPPSSFLQQIKPKISVGICVKAMRFGTWDFSVRLVEWLEMIKLLGGEKVYFYILGAQSSVLKVLNHYTKEGLVDWRNSTLPGEQANTNSLHNLFYTEKIYSYMPQELTELNDCLYQNLYRHQYLLVIDVDEVIIPRETQNQNAFNDWQELLEKMEVRTPFWEKLFSNKNSYFVSPSATVYEAFEEKETTLTGSTLNSSPIPSYLYMMRHIVRALPKKGGANAKCFHSTAHVTLLHNHFPLRCTYSKAGSYHSCKGKEIPRDRALLYHYRRNRGPPEVCNKTTSNNVTRSETEAYDCTIVRDDNSWRYLDVLKQRVRTKLLDIFDDGRFKNAA